LEVSFEGCASALVEASQDVAHQIELLGLSPRPGDCNFWDFSGSISW
jgi:hypothetical protein